MFKQMYKKPFFTCVFCVIYSAVSFAIAIFGKWRTCALEEKEDRKTKGKDNCDWKKTVSWFNFYHPFIAILYSLYCYLKHQPSREIVPWIFYLLYHISSRNFHLCYSCLNREAKEKSGILEWMLANPIHPIKQHEDGFQKRRCDGSSWP